MKIRRITIDIDNKNAINICRAYAVLFVYGYRNISIKTSPSGRGYHLIGWHEKGHYLKDHLEIRKNAGADGARVYMDRMTGRTINILFDEKRTIIFHEAKDLKRGVGIWIAKKNPKKKSRKSKS